MFEFDSFCPPIDPPSPAAKSPNEFLLGTSVPWRLSSSVYSNTDDGKRAPSRHDLMAESFAARPSLRLGALQYLDQAESALPTGLMTGLVVASSVDSLAYSAQRREGRRDEHQSHFSLVEPSLWIIQYPPRQLRHIRCVRSIQVEQLLPHSQQLFAIRAL